MNDNKEDKRTIYEALFLKVSDLLEGGLIAVRKENNTPGEPPVIVDHIIMNIGENSKGEAEFFLGWRPAGVTEEFPNGAFNVNNLEFIDVSSFESKEDEIIFNGTAEEKNVTLHLLPLTEEYKKEWNKWMKFREENRDIFEEIDMQIPFIA